MLYFSVAFLFFLFLVVLLIYSKVFACLFCLSFFIVFNGLITRIGMFYFVLYSITIFSFLGFYPYIISVR